MREDFAPGWLKAIYTVMVIVIAPVFAAEYGVSNYLWFSNIALFGTLLAIWLRSQLLLSMMALAAIVPEIGWNIAFFGRLLTGFEFWNLVGYMFDERIPLWARAVSLYHVPLPFVLIWLLWRNGYDRRAIYWQTGLAIVVLILSFLISEPWQNINMVYGMLDERGQPVVDPPIPLILLMVGLPLLIYLPTHIVLRHYFSANRSRLGSSP